MGMHVFNPSTEKLRDDGVASDSTVTTGEGAASKILSDTQF